MGLAMRVWSVTDWVLIRNSLSKCAICAAERSTIELEKELGVIMQSERGYGARGESRWDRGWVQSSRLLLPWIEAIE